MQDHGAATPEVETAHRPKGREAGRQPGGAAAQNSWPELNGALLRDGVFAVIPVWIVSRLVCLIAIWVSRSGWYPPNTQGGPHSYGVADVGWFLHIAERGYSVQNPGDVGSAAFMPLMPMVMRWGGTLLGGHDLVAGGIAANLAAFVAALSLYVLVRMGLRPGRPNGHSAAVIAIGFFLLSPLAYPLFIAYTEPLLLALALPAWIAARYERWALAGLLASGAVLARVSGLSFAFGIGIMFLLSSSRIARAAATPRRTLPRDLAKACARPAALWVGLPLGVFAAWNVYLAHATGRPSATAYAQETVWHRSVVAPWTGFLTTLSDLFRYRDPQLKMEFAATLVIIAVAIILLLMRLWAEGALVGSAGLILACSSVWGSSLRGLEVMYPFWALLGVLGARLLRRRSGPSWIYGAMSLSALGLFWWATLIVDGVFIP